MNGEVSLLGCKAVAGGTKLCVRSKRRRARCCMAHVSCNVSFKMTAACLFHTAVFGKSGDALHFKSLSVLDRGKNFTVRIRIGLGSKCLG